MKKVALIYNYAQHYRKSIFKKIDDEFNCDFYFGDKLDWAKDIKKMNLSLLRGFRKEVENIRFLNFFIWQKGVLSSIIKNNYSHITLYGDSFYISNWFVLLYCKLFNIKTSIWTHGLYKKMNFPSKLFNICFYKLADYILLYGNYSKNKMMELGFKEKKLKIIYNSLDYENQIYLRDKQSENNVFFDHFNNDLPVFLYIGRVQKIKKIDQVLLALDNLQKTNYNFNFVVVGEGEDLINLLDIAKEKNIERNVWFYGACYQEELIARMIYNSAGVISPGNIGLTAMHSLVYGTPAITHNNFENQMPEFEAIDESITGSFFEENDIKSLESKIKFWIDKSKKERELIRINCFKKIDDFYNPNYQISILKSLYDEAN